MSITVVDSTHVQPGTGSTDVGQNAGQWSLVWRRFRRHRRGVTAFGVFLFLILAVVIGPYFVPFTETSTELPTLWLTTPGAVGQGGGIHLLGTDAVGRDELARLLIGGRVTLTIAFVSTIVTTLVGVLVGAIAGFYGGWADVLLMRIADFLLALPLLPMFILALPAIHSVIAPFQAPPTPGQRFDYTSEPSVYIMATMIFAFVIFGWMGISRLVRSSFLALRSQSFIEASRALGISNRRLIIKHLLPNSMAPVLVAGTFVVGDFIVWESVLSYLNYGIDQAFLPTWGNLIASSQGYVFRLALVDLNPFHDVRIWLALFPALMIFVTVLSINFVAEALRDALDPAALP